MQVEYRNCNYVGDFNFQPYHRQGYGLLVFDNSHIIMARWKSDIINGPFAIITDRIRALGTMNNNKLEGYNVISFQQSLVSNKREKQRTIYGMFRENKLYGKALIIDDQDVIIAHYTDGKLREISEKKPIRDRQVYDMLKICFPNQIYNIWDWLAQIFSKASKGDGSNDGSNRYEPVHKKYQNDVQFYGYAELFQNNKAFGFTMHQAEVISIGDHQRELLEGIGRLYHSDGTVEDGVFKQGQLCGIGISYNRKSHKFILGQHNQQNQQFEKGFGFPQKQINQIRKQFHLRSINFYNDIVLFSFSTLFQAICANCLQYGHQHESPRFSSLNSYNPPNRHHGLPEKSPLRAKLAQYQQESEQIDEPSPIKNKPINQYERVDHRRSNYFENNGNQQIEPIQNRSKSKSNSQRKVQTRSGKQSESRSTQNRKIRDTKQFVRQLDEKQKSRRSYLDQIYKQARIYNRKN